MKRVIVRGANAEELGELVSELNNIGVVVITHGVGKITRQDVKLADKNTYSIIGYRVLPTVAAKKDIADTKVDARVYGLIHEVLDDFKCCTPPEHETLWSKFKKLWT